MKIGVTGANGKVGSYVVNELLEHGYEVKAITWKHWDDSPVEQVQADMTSLEQVQRAVEGCEGIIHLAAFASPSGAVEPFVFQNNVMSVYNVLLTSGLAGIQRVSVASSDCAFGITFSHKETKPIYLPMDELHPTVPDNCYGLSKVVGEQVAEGMAKRFDMSIASMRITHVIGEEEYGRKDYLNMRDNPEADPWNVWSYIDARDCARAFRMSLEASFEGHEVFCIAAVEQRCLLSSKELAKRYFPEVELRKPFAGHESLLDCTKARDILGFVPTYVWPKEL
ncbi:NAD-dependent epimerase/dehydratase family protein [Paenibacillus sp. LMG 31456]|uniref:NAD-dependent epimerase/dehydratase family protein n=1 Tax=Paenibacillus foliorum TaxID=2654974 RepID=A0A972K5G7_9BACL|nr:NAD(P)-dependent oxidoreductase [Paenibacillus foliorum]NOU97988.1 NAD-dependent epimerase/dehydratase family protein [Paenibacillus foliorum]